MHKFLIRRRKCSKKIMSNNFNFRLEHLVTCDQNSGVITYEGNHRNDAVGSIISQAPFSKIFSYFEFEIIDGGENGRITIGAAPANYPSMQQPGWQDGSIGYHADDGGIFVECGWHRNERETCRAGDRMGCGIRYIDERQYVYFTKNCKQIVEWPFGDRENPLYPIVGMHSPREKVRLIGSSVWSRTHDPTDVISFDDPYQFVLQSNIHFNQATRDLSYAVLPTDKETPVASVVGKFPFTNGQKYFEIEITSAGRSGYIAVGAVPRNYPPNRQPGWDSKAIGYHADDGGIFVELGKANQHVAKCGVGDRLGCGVTFHPAERQQYVYFTRNGETVANILFGSYTELLYPAIGLHSVGESARLTVDALWKKPEPSLNMSIGEVRTRLGYEASAAPQYEPNTVSALITDIDREVLECPICMGVLSEPKMLPCDQHTFCAQCLENYVLIQGGRSVPCPVCRVQFVVPPGGVTILKNNIMAQRLIQLRQKYL